MAAHSVKEDNLVLHKQVLKLWDPLGAWPSARPWLWAGMALLAGLAMVPIYRDELSRRDIGMTDFFQEWASARNFMEGLPLYTNHRITIPRYLGITDVNEDDLWVEVNGHPPTTILLAIPLGTLTYRDAYLTWNLLSLGMFLASLGLVWRGFGIPFKAWSLFPAITITLFCFPIIIHIHHGQLTLLVLLLLTGVWAADRANWAIFAGILLGAAVTIKLFPALIFLFFVAQKRWRTVGAGLVSTCLITALTASVLGARSYSVFVQDIVPRVAKFRGVFYNLSVPGYWTKLFDLPPEYPFIQPLTRSPFLSFASTSLSCILILTTLVWVLGRAKTQVQRDLAFGLTLTSMLLISPVTWEHYLLILLVPLAAAWTQLPESQGYRMLFVAIVIAFCSWPCVVYNLAFPGGITRGNASPIYALTIGSYQCYALIAFFLLLVKVSQQSWAQRGGESGLEPRGGSHEPE